MDAVEKVLDVMKKLVLKVAFIITVISIHIICVHKLLSLLRHQNKEKKSNVSHHLHILPLWESSNVLFYRGNRLQGYMSQKHKYILEPKNIYREQMVHVVVLIPSTPSHFATRSKIRDMWLKFCTFKDWFIQHAFLLGIAIQDADQHEIQVESNTEHDIIQADFVDNYWNLTAKVITGLEWIESNCERLYLILKHDEDLVHDPRPYLQSMYEAWWKKNKLEDTILCFDIAKSSPPFRDKTNKWYTTYDEYNNFVYPDFCKGSGGYVFSLQVAHKLLKQSYNVQAFWLEDVFITGILRQMVGGIEIMSLNNFIYD